MNSNVRDMLEVLAISGSDQTRHKAGQILAGTTTVEHELQYSGNFLTHVLNGDFLGALAVADSENKICLKSLIVKY